MYRFVSWKRQGIEATVADARRSVVETVAYPRVVAIRTSYAVGVRASHHPGWLLGGGDAIASRTGCGTRGGRQPNTQKAVNRLPQRVFKLTIRWPSAA